MATMLATIRNPSRSRDRRASSGGGRRRSQWPVSTRRYEWWRAKYRLSLSWPVTVTGGCCNRLGANATTRQRRSSRVQTRNLNNAVTRGNTQPGERALPPKPAKRLAACDTHMRKSVRELVDLTGHPPDRGRQGKPTDRRSGGSTNTVDHLSRTRQQPGNYHRTGANQRATPLRQQMAEHPPSRTRPRQLAMPTMRSTHRPASTATNTAVSVSRPRATTQPRRQPPRPH